MLLKVMKWVHKQLMLMFCVIAILCAIQDKIIQLCSCKMQKVNSSKLWKGFGIGTIYTQFSVNEKERERCIYLAFFLIFHRPAGSRPFLQEESHHRVALQASNTVLTLPLLIMNHGFFTEFERPQGQGFSRCDLSEPFFIYQEFCFNKAHINCQRNLSNDQHLQSSFAVVIRYL